MDDFRALRDLEARRAGPLTYAVKGLIYRAPEPVEMPFEAVLRALQDGEFARIPNMPVWQIPLLFGRWVAHHDLPEFQDAQRLTYVVNRYRDALENDLHIHANGADLTSLWRSRRWRLLLNLIDHLPRHTYYSEAVANDPEHAKMLADAMEKQREAAGDEQGPTGPAMHTWSPEVAALADLTDAVRRVEYVLIAVNSEKGQGPKPPEPVARPVSTLDRERKRSAYAARKKRHDKLAARMLPHKDPNYVRPSLAEPGLPEGWSYDGAGRLRNERGRYAKMPE